jgi:hypothetical protein
VQCAHRQLGRSECGCRSVGAAQCPTVGLFITRFACADQVPTCTTPAVLFSLLFTECGVCFADASLACGCLSKLDSCMLLCGCAISSRACQQSHVLLSVTCQLRPCKGPSTLVCCVAVHPYAVLMIPSAEMKGWGSGFWWCCISDGIHVDMIMLTRYPVQCINVLCACVVCRCGVCAVEWWRAVRSISACVACVVCLAQCLSFCPCW